MGGCCCSSRKPQLHGTPVYYYCPPVLEERESLTSDDGAATAFTSGLLVDLNLDTSSPETFRPPPAPIPYDVVLGHPQSVGSVPVREAIDSSGFVMACLDLKEAQAEFTIASPKKCGIEIRKMKELDISATDDEDVCPTCLEEYDVENPKIATKCNHYFHLSCILEWMERSDTCPICDQV